SAYRFHKTGHCGFRAFSSTRPPMAPSKPSVRSFHAPEKRPGPWRALTAAVLRAATIGANLGAGRQVKQPGMYGWAEKVAPAAQRKNALYPAKADFLRKGTAAPNEAEPIAGQKRMKKRFEFALRHIPA